MFKQSAQISFPFDARSWLYLKSQAYAESGFNPNAVSPVGALGISQFMPGTARGMGGTTQQALDPAWAIVAQGRYMKIMWHYFPSITDETTHWAFADASYNSGAGNVLKSQLLTKNLGGQWQQWWGGVREHQITNPSSVRQTSDYVDRINGYEKQLEKK